MAEFGDHGVVFVFFLDQFQPFVQPFYGGVDFFVVQVRFDGKFRMELYSPAVANSKGVMVLQGACGENRCTRGNNLCELVMDAIEICILFAVLAKDFVPITNKRNHLQADFRPLGFFCGLAAQQVCQQLVPVANSKNREVGLAFQKVLQCVEAKRVTLVWIRHHVVGTCNDQPSNFVIPEIAGKVLVRDDGCGRLQFLWNPLVNPFREISDSFPEIRVSTAYIQNDQISLHICEVRNGSGFWKETKKCFLGDFFCV